MAASKHHSRNPCTVPNIEDKRKQWVERALGRGEVLDEHISRRTTSYHLDTLIPALEAISPNLVPAHQDLKLKVDNLLLALNTFRVDGDFGEHRGAVIAIKTVLQDLTDILDTAFPGNHDLRLWSDKCRAYARSPDVISLANGARMKFVDHEGR